jgi:hypothetical protein
VEDRFVRHWLDMIAGSAELSVQLRQETRPRCYLARRRRHWWLRGNSGDEPSDFDTFIAGAAVIDWEAVHRRQIDSRVSRLLARLARRSLVSQLALDLSPTVDHGSGEPLPLVSLLVDQLAIAPHAPSAGGVAAVAA